MAAAVGRGYGTAVVVALVGEDEAVAEDDAGTGSTIGALTMPAQSAPAAALAPAALLLLVLLVFEMMRGEVRPPWRV